MVSGKLDVVVVVGARRGGGWSVAVAAAAAAPAGAINARYRRGGDRAPHTHVLSLGGRCLPLPRTTDVVDSPAVPSLIAASDRPPIAETDF